MSMEKIIREVLTQREAKKWYGSWQGEEGQMKGFWNWKKKYHVCTLMVATEKNKKDKRQRKRGDSLEQCPTGWDLGCKSEGIGTASSSTVWTRGRGCGWWWGRVIVIWGCSLLCWKLEQREYMKSMSRRVGESIARKLEWLCSSILKAHLMFVVISLRWYCQHCQAFSPAKFSCTMVGTEQPTLGFNQGFEFAETFLKHGRDKR